MRACKRESARFLGEQEKGKDESTRENQERARERERVCVCERGACVDVLVQYDVIMWCVAYMHARILACIAGKCEFSVSSV